MAFPSEAVEQHQDFFYRMGRNRVTNIRANEVGEIEPDKVRSLIKVRNETEASVSGVAARLLAQLDGEYASSGHLAPSCAVLRENLLQAVFSGEQETLIRLVEKGRKLGFLDDKCLGVKTWVRRKRSPFFH